MLRKLLLVNLRELELVMVNMTNEWLKSMNHVLQQTDNITTIYRIDHLE